MTLVLNVYGAIAVGGRLVDGMRNRRAASRDRHAIAIPGSDTATIADAIPLRFPRGSGRAEEHFDQPGGVGWNGFGNGRG